ncbi:hypothetical protein Trydic_g20436 [Trypoxylus dichotomus]
MANTKIFFCLLFCILKLATGAVDYCWKHYTKDIPACAVSTNGIVIAQVVYGDLLPASFYPSTKTAITEDAGKKVVVSKGIWILCSDNSSQFYWEHVTTNSLTGDGLKDLVIGGFEVGTTLYIGKVFHQGVWKVGKVFPASSAYRGFRGWCTKLRWEGNQPKRSLEDELQHLKDMLLQSRLKEITDTINRQPKQEEELKTIIGTTYLPYNKGHGQNLSSVLPRN